jgi:hypothetical protein
MENQDSLTPTQYGKMVGMFPDPPHNPLPTGGYMDAGFDWVVHQAESKSMFGKDKNGKMYARRRNGEIITHNAEEEMTVDEVNEMVKNLGDVAYNEFCYRFDIDPEDAQEMSWFIADHYDSPKIVSWLMENHDKFDAESFGAESFAANEKPICKCGRYCDGDPRFLEQECLDCKKISHQMCGDGRKAYNNCAFCKSFNIRTTNLDEWRKLQGLEPLNIDFGGFGAESFNAEDMNCAICGTWEAAHKMDITTGSCLRCVSKGFNADDKVSLRVWAKDMEKDHLGYFVSKNKDGWETWKGLCGITTDKGVSRGFNVSNYDGSYGRRCRKCLTAYKKMDAEYDFSQKSAESFKAEMKPSRDWLSLALGTAAVVIGGSLFVQNRSMFKADGDEMAPVGTGQPSLVAHPSTGDLLPADYEEMIVESTGYAVPIIPVSLDPAFMGSRFHALPTNRVVESNEPGIGAHTDVAMTRDTDFREPEQSMITRFNADGGNCKCSLIERLKSFITGKSCCEGKQVKEANSVTGQTPYFGVGFDGKNTQTRVIKETNPVSLDPSTAPYIPQNLSGYTGQAYTPPTVYSDMMNIGVSGQNPAFVSTQSSSLQSVHGNLSAGMNQSYTDGSRTMSLSQWSIDYDVSQTSDSEAFAVSRSSGVRTMIRRV